MIKNLWNKLIKFLLSEKTTSMIEEVNKIVEQEQITKARIAKIEAEIEAELKKIKRKKKQNDSSSN